jgi:CHAT domain-containing protein
LPQIQQLLQLVWLNLRSVPRSSVKQQILSADNMRGILQKLYKLLMVPLETFLASYSNLIVVPHGPLHYLPFHALYIDDTPLLLQKEISYLPSASILRHSQEAKTFGTECVVLGHSYKGHLPNAVDEARNVAQLLGSKAFVEQEATVAALRAAATNGRILHLATHGDFRSDNPIFSGLAFADSWLTTLDIFSLRLQASLVTLSACQTGRNVIGGGDELLGLMRAFLSAGAASLVLSLWAVEDLSTARLMQEFYSELAADKTKREALRNAQRLLLEVTSKEHPQYTHPYYWAPFYLVGNTGKL